MGKVTGCALATPAEAGQQHAGSHAGSVSPPPSSGQLLSAGAASMTDLKLLSVLSLSQQAEAQILLWVSGCKALPGTQPQHLQELWGTWATSHYTAKAASTGLAITCFRDIGPDLQTPTLHVCCQQCRIVSSGHGSRPGRLPRADCRRCHGGLCTEAPQASWAAHSS